MPDFPITVDWMDVNKKLVIDLAKLEEAEEICLFLVQHFFSVSPKVHLFSWDEENPEDEQVQKQNQEMILSYLLDCLNSGPYSLTVRDQTADDRLIAVLINRIEKRPDQAEDNQIKFPDRLFFAFTGALKQDVDLYDLYQTDVLIHFCMVSVDEQYGRRGLATKLIELAISLASQCGAGAIKAEALSNYAAKGFAKLGFITHKTIDYASFEYKGVKPLLENEKLLAEHRAATLIARRLP